jgi:hypothetical protein
MAKQCPLRGRETGLDFTMSIPFRQTSLALGAEPVGHGRTARALAYHPSSARSPPLSRQIKSLFALFEDAVLWDPFSRRVCQLFP